MTEGPAASLRPLGTALYDYHRGRHDAELLVRYDTGDEVVLPARWFFRAEDELEPLEVAALKRCSGRVLDVGAGAGAVALPLQRRGTDVTALEIQPLAAACLRERGVRRVVEGDLWDVELPGGYDTVLALMNGTGLAGTAARLPHLFDRLGGFTAPGGRILIDSDDFTEEGDPGDGRHAGEVQIQLSYLGRPGPPFAHLYATEGWVRSSAEAVGWRAEVVARDGGRFLASLQREDDRG